MKEHTRDTTSTMHAPDYEDQRAPEEIAHDIERTRAEMSSTIDAIQSKMTPGQLMDQAFAYARDSLPADFGANLGNAVRQNPVPVALVGIGLAWLMMSGQRGSVGAYSRDRYARDRYRSRSAFDSGYDGEYERDYYASDSDTEYEGGYGIEYASSDLAGDYGRSDGAGNDEGTMTRMADAGRNAKERVAETGHQIADKASELGHRISDKASELTGRAREAGANMRARMHGGSGNARARMDEVSRRSQQQYYRAKDSVSHMIDEQPLLLGAIGLAVGAALGAALPATRREDEWMGRTRDDVMNRASEVGREQAGHLKESAQRVAQTVKQEAERVGGQTEQRMGEAEGRQAGSVGSTTTGGSQSLH